MHSSLPTQRGRRSGLPRGVGDSFSLPPAQARILGQYEYLLPSLLFLTHLCKILEAAHDGCDFCFSVCPVRTLVPRFSFEIRTSSSPRVTCDACIQLWRSDACEKWQELEAPILPLSSPFFYVFKSIVYGKICPSSAFFFFFFFVQWSSSSFRGVNAMATLTAHLQPWELEFIVEFPLYR